MNKDENLPAHPQKATLIKKALILEWILIVYNIFEAVASIGFGFLAGSIALIGFGFDSVIEVSSAGVLVWRLSHRGSLEEESEKEKKALRFVGITFFLLAAYVGFESVTKLIHHEVSQESFAGMIIAVLSLIIMPFLGLAKLKIAKQIGSKALEADSMETMLCFYLSIVLLAGLGLNALFGWWWADPVAGLIMIYFMVKEGLEAFEEN